ncbi:hypothetical protein ACFLU3_00905 [Chloroflexota bacterium]
MFVKRVNTSVRLNMNVKHVLCIITIVSASLFSIGSRCDNGPEKITCSIEFDTPPKSIEYITQSSPWQGVPPTIYDPEWEPLFSNDCKDITFGDDSSHWYGVIREASDLDKCLSPHIMSTNIGNQLSKTDFDNQNVIIIELMHSSTITTEYTLRKIKGNTMELRFEEWGPNERTEDSVPSQYIFVVSY